MNSTINLVTEYMAVNYIANLVSIGLIRCVPTVWERTVMVFLNRARDWLDVDIKLDVIHAGYNPALPYQYCLDMLAVELPHYLKQKLTADIELQIEEETA